MAFVLDEDRGVLAARVGPARFVDEQERPANRLAARRPARARRRVDAAAVVRLREEQHDLPRGALDDDLQVLAVVLVRHVQTEVDRRPVARMEDVVGEEVVCRGRERRVVQCGRQLVVRQVLPVVVAAQVAIEVDPRGQVLPAALGVDGVIDEGRVTPRQLEVAVDDEGAVGRSQRRHEQRRRALDVQRHEQGQGRSRQDPAPPAPRVAQPARPGSIEHPVRVPGGRAA
jgi:hypothetical protein